MPTGFGFAPFGTSPYGVGTPNVYADAGGVALGNPATGISDGSRLVDPVTGDYVLNDTTGRLEGMGSTKQLVLLSIGTTLGASGFQALGNQLKNIDRITSNIERRVDSALRACVQRLVDDGLIVVIGVTVELPRPGVVFARFKWRDLSTNLDDENTVALTR